MAIPEVGVVLPRAISIEEEGLPVMLVLLGSLPPYRPIQDRSLVSTYTNTNTNKYPLMCYSLPFKCKSTQLCSTPPLTLPRP